MSATTAGREQWDQRHRGREAALHALYQLAVGRLELDDAMPLIGEVGEDNAAPLDDETRTFAVRLAKGAWESRAELDAIIEPLCTNWRLDRLAVLDHLVLRLAIHEWLTEPTTPPRVVLSEALELARDYSGDSAVRFVNGVLDAAFRQLRMDGRIID